MVGNFFVMWRCQILPQSWQAKVSNGVVDKVGGSLIVLQSSSSGVKEVMTSDEKDFDKYCHVILLESVCDTFKRFSQRITEKEHYV